MITLPAVNVFMALIDRRRVNHVQVTCWLTTCVPANLPASCPPTQNGAARIIGMRAHLHPKPATDDLQRLAAMTARPAHQFGADDFRCAPEAPKPSQLQMR